MEMMASSEMRTMPAKRASERFTASSARLRSVISRKRTVSTFSPPTSNLEIEASAGNSEPSLRNPKMEPRSFMARSESADAPNFWI